MVISPLPLRIANPTDTLTYRITVTNNSASVNATSVVITDPEPQFTTYVGGSAKMNTDTGFDYSEATNTVLTDAAGGDTYDFGVTTPGVATYSYGTLAPGTKVVLFYQVTID